MKDMKVKNKLLFGFGILIFFMLVVSALAVLGLRSLHQENTTLVEKTLANTEYVWEMRRNLMSEQRYELMIFAENDPEQTRACLDAVQQEVDRNGAIMEKYKKNCSIEQSKMDELESCFEKETQPRKNIVELLNKGTEQSRASAFKIFEEELKPLLEEQAVLLAEIGDSQITLAEQQVDKGQSTYKRTLAITLGLIVLALVISAIVVRKLLKGITAPLFEIEHAARSLSQGDFAAQITYESRDELGETCKSMQVSFMKLKDMISDMSAVLGALSRGDLTRTLSMEFPGEMKEIETSVHILTDNLNRSMHAIQLSAEQITAGARQVSEGSQELAQGATEQASSVEELSATITEISTQVEENSENAGKANVLAAASGEVAQATLQDMEEMIHAMEEISATAENIKKVIKVIDDIAFQTNILALNAAVEAARAGSAGKGFAVVADEVRNLAGKSSEAAKSTTTLIESALEAVTHGEEIAGKTNVAFSELAEKVAEVVSTIGEISAASEEQADAIRQITTGVDQISSVVQTNSATSEESAAASQQLSGQAYMLDDLVKKFRLSDDTYDEQNQ